MLGDARSSHGGLMHAGKFPWHTCKSRTNLKPKPGCGVILTLGRRSSSGIATTSFFAYRLADQPILCRLSVTLWRDPLICRGVTWLSSVGLIGFATAVREAFPELGKKDISLFLLPKDTLWESGRVRITSDVILSRAACQIASSHRAYPFSGNHPTLFVHDDGESPTSSPGHARLASSPAPSTVSGSSSGSRPRHQQNMMRQRVLLRDRNRCVVCGLANVAYLECAHIVDHSVNRRKDSDAILDAAGIRSTFDDINGLTLCKKCHAGFGHQLFCFDARSRVIILGVKEKIGSRVGPWRSLAGKSIRVCDAREVNYWPPQSLFNFQQQRFFDENNKVSPGSFPTGGHAAIAALSGKSIASPLTEGRLVIMPGDPFKTLTEAAPGGQSTHSVMAAPSAAASLFAENRRQSAVALPVDYADVMNATSRSLHAQGAPALRASIESTLQGRISLHSSQCLSSSRLSTASLHRQTLAALPARDAIPIPAAPPSLRTFASTASTMPSLRRAVGASAPAAIIGLVPASGPRRSQRIFADADLYAGQSHPSAF